MVLHQVRGISNLLIANLIRTSNIPSVVLQCNDSSLRWNLVQNVRCYAARAGKREKMRAEKKKRKQEMVVKEHVFVPYHIKLAKENVLTGPKRYKVDYWLKSSPVDDVWCKVHYPRPFYDAIEAIEMHRETNHPTMLNAPNSLLHLKVELDLQLSKKNKYLEKFTDTIRYPHYFDRGTTNRVIAFCKTEADAVKAINAGAVMSGGKQLIQQFHNGEVTEDDFDHVVALPDILQELISIRGILKKHFPMQQKRSLGTDIEALVDYFHKGFTFKSQSDSYELDYGCVDAPVGRLDMANEQVEENIAALLNHIKMFTPKGNDGKFVTQVLLSCATTNEKFVLKHWKYLEGYAEIKWPPITEWLQEQAQKQQKQSEVYSMASA